MKRLLLQKMILKKNSHAIIPVTQFTCLDDFNGNKSPLGPSSKILTTAKINLPTCLVERILKRCIPSSTNAKTSSFDLKFSPLTETPFLEQK